MRIAVLGAGAGGASAVVELTQRGIATRLWNRSAATLAPMIEAGGVRYEGVLGSGLATPELISAELGQVIEGAAGVLICLPTSAHGGVAESLAQIGIVLPPVVLNPGHTGGGLEFRATFRRKGMAEPPSAEFSTLTYVARKPAPDRVRITGVARSVHAAALPGGAAALDLARELFPAARPVADVLATGLSNVNMVLHPPGAILGAAWVEATRGAFTFYVEGLSDGVARVMEALDAERQRVGAAFGHSLPGLFEEMQAIGTIEAGADRAAGLGAAVRGGEANRRIRAPDSLSHRYYVEDFWFGLKPFLEFARIAEVQTPVAAALFTLGQTLVGGSRVEGRSAERMGIADMSKRQLLEFVRS
jgi:opine dehydrogenase